eukprot:1154741-Pelagomonas_calceolata.AAC.1
MHSFCSIEHRIADVAGSRRNAVQKLGSGPQQSPQGPHVQSLQHQAQQHVRVKGAEENAIVWCSSSFLQALAPSGPSKAPML